MLDEKSKAKIAECIRTKIVYVNEIKKEQLAALHAKGFTVVINRRKP